MNDKLFSIEGFQREFDKITDDQLDGMIRRAKEKQYAKEREIIEERGRKYRAQKASEKDNKS